MLRTVLLRESLLATTVRPLQLPSFKRATASLIGGSPSWKKLLRQSSSAAAVASDEPTSEPLSSHDIPSTPPPAHDILTESKIKDRLPPWLRPYQVDVIENCVNALERGLQRIGVSSPTGSGKTVMFTHLIPLLLARGDPGGSVLVLVGNIELARQAFSTIETSHPEYTVELEQGSTVASGRADVTIATYQTLRQDSRLAKYNPARFRGVIVDEAHHAAAPSYIKLLSHFNSDVKANSNGTADSDAASVSDREQIAPLENSAWPSSGNASNVSAKTTITLPSANVPIIGFTATFSRHDALALSQVFEEIVYHQDVIDMLDQGWLAPARFTTVKANLDLSRVTINKSSDDFSSKSLAKAMNTPAVNELVVKVYLDRARDRSSTLIFCVDLAHVVELTDAFRKAGIDARYVTGNTKDSERKALVEAFKAGEFPVMINCQLFTEGTDIPNIDCIFIARPTRSRNLFSQMIGRGLRHSPGKADCRIIDLVDNVGNNGGLVTAPTLFGLDIDTAIDDETLGSLREKAVQEKSIQPDVQIEDRVAYMEDDDPFRLEDDSSTNARVKAKYAWVSCGDNKYVLDAFSTEIFSIIKENSLFQIRHTHKLPNARLARGEKFFPYAKWTIFGRAESLEQAFRAGDVLVEKMVERALLPRLYRWAEWRRRPATPAQLAMLERMGFSDTKLQDSADGSESSVHRYTCGQVASILTALKHGAKGRAAKHEKRTTREENIKNRKSRKEASHSISVGPLAPSGR